MKPQNNSWNTPHIYWIVYDDFTRKLSSASRLEITRELRGMGWKVTLVSIGADGLQTVDGVETYCLSSPAVYLLGQAMFHLKAIFYMWRVQPAPDVVFFYAGLTALHAAAVVLAKSYWKTTPNLRDGHPYTAYAGC